MHVIKKAGGARSPRRPRVQPGQSGVKADFDYLALNNVVSILSSEPAGASCLFTLVERKGRRGGEGEERRRGGGEGGGVGDRESPWGALGYLSSDDPPRAPWDVML